MKKLNKDWITEKTVDFEYKKYVLLAWIQHVEESFRANKLFPPLSELLEHYRTTLQLRDNKAQLFSQFPKRVTGLDAEDLKLKFEHLLEDDKLMSEINSIIDFSIPRFEEGLREGKQIYDFLEQGIEMDSVGIIPIHVNEGYIFLRNATSETRVYSYSITLFEEAGDKFRGMHTHYVRTYDSGFLSGYEQIKLRMLEEFRDLPNPACYAMESKFRIPMEETFLPIAKRKLLRELKAA
ncbi:MAG: hypothetical protein HY064_10905 [Bacteroidetes bacterium]|nr:hypothetical protein [Bacteroidota bacterium]